MSTPALRLADLELADPASAIAALRRRLDERNEMLAEAHEEIKAAHDAQTRYFHESQRLKAHLYRLETHEIEPHEELAEALHAFWCALKGRRLQFGPAAKKAVKNVMTKLEPTPTPLDLAWAIIGLVIDPTPRRNGKGYYTSFTLPIRDDEKLEEYRERGRSWARVDSKGMRQLVEEFAGPCALEALYRLLDIQKQMDGKESA